MAVVMKKKKKKSRIRSAGSSGGSGVETSPLRPEHVEKKAPCMVGCPSGTRIREVMTTIAQTEDAGRTYPESYAMAYNIFLENNPLPSVCGRVCPHPCESECNRQYKDGAVTINNIERFVGDYAIEQNLPIKKLTEEVYKEKIAIIGSGPAGLSAAYHLARLGYSNVKIFEANEKPGGMLKYGIPDYRLPSNILDKEIQRILDLGIQVQYNTKIGQDIPYEKIQNDFDAIFVGIGAHLGKRLHLDNEDASNVMTGVDFLHKINSGETIDVGDKVLVIGGGDTAIDAARISKRLGADVTVVYRRTRNEMPAIEEDIVGGEEEGLNFEFLVAPLELIKDGDKIVKMRCQKMELGEPDESGRRRPIPIEGEEITFDCSFIIPAISQEPNFDGLDNLHEGKDWIKVEENFRASLEKTYAGGDDIDLGLVTIAIAQGKMAARTIHNNFRGIEPEPETDMEVVRQNKIVMSYYEEKARIEEEKLSPDERLKGIDLEISNTLSEEQAIEDAKRCFSCGSCFDCGTCWSLCQDQAIHKPLERFQEYTFKLDLCKGCSKCAEACPCGYIEMKNPMTGQYAERGIDGKVIVQ